MIWRHESEFQYCECVQRHLTVRIVLHCTHQTCQIQASGYKAEILQPRFSGHNAMMPGPVFGEICLLTVPHLVLIQISLTSDSSHYHKLLATTPRQDKVDTRLHISSSVCSLLRVTRCLRRRCWKCTTSQHDSNPSITINIEIRTARLTTQSCAVTKVASSNGPI